MISFRFEILVSSVLIPNKFPHVASFIDLPLHFESQHSWTHCFTDGLKLGRFVPSEHYRHTCIITTYGKKHNFSFWQCFFKRWTSGRGRWLFIVYLCYKDRAGLVFFLVVFPRVTWYLGKCQVDWKERILTNHRIQDHRKLTWLSCLIFKLPSKAVRMLGGAQEGGHSNCILILH